MPGFLSDLVTSIAAVLATNFGAVLGLPPARAALFSLSSAGAESLFTGDLTDVAQRVACWLYMIGLVAAAIVWAIKNFTTDDKQIVPLIPQLTRSLIGVAIGALAVILKVHQ